MLHLRRGAVRSWHIIREFPAHSIAGAEFRERALLWGPIIVRTRDGQLTWIRLDSDALARRFVDSLNALVAGRR